MSSIAKLSVPQVRLRLPAVLFAEVAGHEAIKPASSAASDEEKQATAEAALLQQALGCLLEEHGGVVSANYDDRTGTRRDVSLAFRTKDFPRGIGITLGAEGELQFVYDSDAGEEPIAGNLCAELKQHYVVLALLKTQRDRGYSVTAVRQPLEAGGFLVHIGAARDGEVSENRITVDPRGEVVADFVAYRGQTCKKEMSTLLRSVGELGVVTSVDAARDKSSSESDEETRTARLGHQRSLPFAPGVTERKGVHDELGTQ
jgi:hypothetical protein